MSVLVNCKELSMKKTIHSGGQIGCGNEKVNASLLELQEAIIRYIQRLPGNDRCCDCNSQNDATWLSTNFGIIVCIECSGIHRDMGVHISRIQSLTLDNLCTSQLLLARFMTNQAFNEVMEATLNYGIKLDPSSTMEARYEYIRAKYVDKRFVLRTCEDERDLLCELEHACNNKDLQQLLQVFAENVDLSAVLPTSDYGETALHLVVAREMNDSLPLVDFLVQNMPSQGIDKVTAIPFNSTEHSGSNSALHLCAMHNKTECMKLLLRTGANQDIRNSDGKTPMDIAQEMQHHTCIDLVRITLIYSKN